MGFETLLDTILWLYLPKPLKTGFGISVIEYATKERWMEYIISFPFVSAFDLEDNLEGFF